MEQKPLARIKIQLHYPSFSSEQKNHLLCLQNRCRKPSLSTFVPFDDSQMGCCGVTTQHPLFKCTCCEYYGKIFVNKS